MRSKWTTNFTVWVGWVNLSRPQWHIYVSVKKATVELAGTTKQDWAWTFGHAPLNSCSFLGSDWSSSFLTFPVGGYYRNGLVCPSVPSFMLLSVTLSRLSHVSGQNSQGWIWNLVDTRPEIFSIIFHWITTVSWMLIDWTVSTYLQTNHLWDWAQIWWANALWTSPDWLTFAHHVLLNLSSDLKTLEYHLQNGRSFVSASLCDEESQVCLPKCIQCL